jgi:DNA-binding transcriptional ArsR family regulator
VASLKSVLLLFQRPDDLFGEPKGAIELTPAEAASSTRGKGLDNRRQARILKQVLNHQLDLMYAALSDGSRRLMVDRLSRGPATVKELAEPLTMSLPAVLQHLRVLEESGLVSSAKAGRVRTCRLEPVALQAAERWIADRRAGWVSRLDRLDTFLNEEESP